jgi:hypothetical protein
VVPLSTPTITNVSGLCRCMEYPMVLFCNDDFSKAGLFSVTLYELGHTWFPMVVNTDERRFPWMDEGFNTFINFYDRFDVYNAESGMVDQCRVKEAHPQVAVAATAHSGESADRSSRHN